MTVDINEIIIGELREIRTTQGEMFGLLRDAAKDVGDIKIEMAKMDGRIKPLESFKELNESKEKESKKSILAIALVLLTAVAGFGFALLKDRFLR